MTPMTPRGPCRFNMRFVALLIASGVAIRHDHEQPLEDAESQTTVQSPQN